MNLNRSSVSYGGWREGGSEEGRSQLNFLWEEKMLHLFREKKIAAGENLERTRRIELLESSI